MLKKNGFFMKYYLKYILTLNYSHNRLQVVTHTILSHLACIKHLTNFWYLLEID